MRGSHNTTALAVGLGCCCVILTASMPAFAGSPGSGEDLPSAFGRLPLAFESNEGQADPKVRYLARGPGYQVMLTSEGAVISLKSPIASARRGDDSPRPDAAIAMHLAGALESPQLSG